MAKSNDNKSEKGALAAKGADKNGANVKAKNKKKADKDKKPNFFVRTGRKFKETFSELKRVSWPSFMKALKSTGIVLLIVLIFTIATAGVDALFSWLLNLLTGLGG